MKKTAKYDSEKTEDLKHYIHGFQQQKLIDLQLSNDDALLLRVLVDMYSMASAECITENDNRYLWVSYNKVVRTIPILGSKSNIMGKVKNFEDLKLIDRITKFEKKGVKGTFAYVRPLERLDWLTEYQNDKEDPIQNLDRGCPEFRQGVSKFSIGGIQNLDNKDPSLKDSSLKDSKDIQENEPEKIKKEKPEKIKYAENVKLTEIEYNKLVTDIGEDKTKDMIVTLNLYKGSTGKPYKSDYMTILNWLNKEKKKNANKKQSAYAGAF